jgi:ABC-type antimicrobial peptide transport system permease subunit
VGQRTREIGLRLALGATREDIRRMVLGETARPVLLGTLLGALGGFVLARTMAGLLYGVGGDDPLTFAALSGFLAGAALLAGALPARRAARLSPLSALRQA